MNNIENNLGVAYTAHCDQCAVDHSNNTDSFIFSEKLYKLGWRYDEDLGMVCPKCAPEAK